MKLSLLILLNLCIFTCSEKKPEPVLINNTILFKIKELSFDWYEAEAIVGDSKTAEKIEKERLSLQQSVFKPGILLKFRAERGCELSTSEDNERNEINYSCTNNLHPDHPMIQQFHYKLRIRNLKGFKFNLDSLKELVLLLEPEVLNPDCVPKPACFERDVIVDQGYSYVPIILGLAVTINGKQ